MQLNEYTPKKWRVAANAALFTLLSQLLIPTGALAQPAAGSPPPSAVTGPQTKTPIQHVIVIIGENRTFDHVFATYQPTIKGETVDNLLSKGIIRADGSPGPNYGLAVQFSAVDTSADGFQISPGGLSLYSNLPPPVVGGYFNPPFSSVADARKHENGLASDYYKFLTTGGTSPLSKPDIDTRIPNVYNLPPGPFQLSSFSFPYDSYANSPVHRFYQMWQQQDCNAFYATQSNPSGCLADLFPWVEVSIGAGNNGKKQPNPFTDTTTGEGATAMGFYNVAQGDVPYFKFLADHYAMNDNFHQSVMGGTGANHIMLGMGDAIWFSDSQGRPMRPPHNEVVGKGSKNQGKVDEIENPNARAGTNNWYLQDGYGGGSSGSPSYGGGSYSNCSDSTQPGVTAVLNFLSDLPYQVDPKCDPGRYYLLNNYNPGYFGDGSDAYTDNSDSNTVFTIPPSSVRNIGDELLEHNISFAYYGDQYNLYLTDKYYLNPNNQYCNICNFFQYSTSIMTNPAVRTAHLKDTTDLYAAITRGTLPSVSFVKPSGFVDGHPASSKLNLFEGFVKKIVDAVQANPTLWASTAIFITFDEGGGYYDSGYVQPLDFFGDGTRIPMLLVSPYTKAGHISHQYNDHVSVLKFIEHNWGLPPVTERSRDNLPNPIPSRSNRYAPSNSPAIGDLTDLFSF